MGQSRIEGRQEGGDVAGDPVTQSLIDERSAFFCTGRLADHADRPTVRGRRIMSPALPIGLSKILPLPISRAACAALAGRRICTGSMLMLAVWWWAIVLRQREVKG